jgi:threonine/homoserine/homoserine lactone efflux protein
MISDNTLHFLALGALLGFSAGISPGPILTLVLTQTIKHNKKEGIKVALSPLITDFPIILISLLIFKSLSQFDLVLAIISFIGGIFIAYLGVQSIRTKGISLEIDDSGSASFQKGILANLFNPSPYVFWATVGTPYIFKAFEINLLTAILFLTSFYVLLIGSKIAIAIVVARTKVFIGQKLYVWIMRILGLALLIFSIIFFYDGVQYLKSIL